MDHESHELNLENLITELLCMHQYEYNSYTHHMLHSRSPQMVRWSWLLKASSIPVIGSNAIPSSPQYFMAPVTSLKLLSCQSPNLQLYHNYILNTNIASLEGITDLCSTSQNCISTNLTAAIESAVQVGHPCIIHIDLQFNNIPRCAWIKFHPGLVGRVGKIRVPTTREWQWHLGHVISDIEGQHQSSSTAQQCQQSVMSVLNTISFFPSRKP